MRELANLDRCAERTGAEFEAKPFIGISGVRLHVSDNGQVHERKCNRVEIGGAQEPPIALANRAKGIELG